MTGVCVSLFASSTSDLLRDLTFAEGLADVVEIRGDLGPDLDLDQIRRASRKPLIYTCRAASEGGALADDDPRRGDRLERAAIAGFDHIDIEFASRRALEPVIADRAGRSLILSHHDLVRTPADADLDDLYARMCDAGADIVKIVTTPQTIGDIARLLHFACRATRSGRRPLIALAMGPMGQATRVLAARTGAPFTYASLRRGAEAAPGQIPAAELRSGYRIQNLTSSTRVFGIVGSDVTRSLSPAIHNAAFEATGIDAVYVPFSSDDLSGFMQVAAAVDLDGFSVTRPFKRDVIAFLTSADSSAESAASVNTVTRYGTSWTGSSTDGHGVVTPLSRHLDIVGARVAILGAGGAARAAASALAAVGARVDLSARDDHKARATAASLGVQATPWTDRARGAYDVIINATPLGSHEALDETPVSRERLRTEAVVFDMVYAPLETRLLREARAAGCRTIDGVSMLVAQAAAQFETWTGVAAPLETMDRAARSTASDAAC